VLWTNQRIVDRNRSGGAAKRCLCDLFVICAYGLSNVISADLIGAISDKQNLRVGMLIAPTAFLLSAFLLLTYTLLPRRRASIEIPTTGLASA